MTDKVWLLREHNGSYYGKFFTSPFTAAAKGERLRRSGPNPDAVQYFVDMYALDLEDIPCDHISMEHFQRHFLSFLHGGAHDHGFVLLEQSPTIYRVVNKGNVVGNVQILFLPPDPTNDDPDDLGEPVLREVPTETEVCRPLMDDFILRFTEYAQKAW